MKAPRGKSGRSLLHGASRFLLLMIGIALLQLRRGEDDGSPPPPTGEDGQGSGTEDWEDPGLRKVDQAALMGAALAAILAIFLPAGKWDRWGTVVGITLSFVVAGYYRIPSSPPSPDGLWGGWWDAFTRAGAVAGVAALCLSIALAYPLQQRSVSDTKCRYETLRDYPGLAADRLDELTSNCIGYKAGQKLQPIWLGLAAVILIVHIVRWHPQPDAKGKRTPSPRRR
jgi:hypothetical protein